MKFTRLTLFVIIGLLPIFSSCTRQSLPTDSSIPGWLQKLVLESGRPPAQIEKTRYKGQPAYNIVATDRADTGDEHALYSADGILICRYGGFVGRVTSGSCELDKLVYVSTLYAPKNR